MFSVRKLPLNMECQSLNLGDIKIANPTKIMTPVEEFMLTDLQEVGYAVDLTTYVYVTCSILWFLHV